MTQSLLTESAYEFMLMLWAKASRVGYQATIHSFTGFVRVGL